MSIIVVDATSIVPQPWRNGGGQTRELLTWPAGDGWKLRISVADIESDGPFSAFDGVQRWFTVLQGAGVELAFSEAKHILRPGDEPLKFEGGRFPFCQLLDGPTRDLNLMAKDGTAIMQKVEPGQVWEPTFTLRGLYTEVSGHWANSHQQRTLSPQSLLLVEGDDSAAWHFLPDDRSSPCHAWWLGYSQT